MALVSKAQAAWQGDLLTGSGQINLATSGLANFSYNWKARTEGENRVTTPEELLGAAHAGCFAMALANDLSTAGFTPTSVTAQAAVSFDIAAGGITGIELTVEAHVPDITNDEFQRIATGTKSGCPVSKALASVAITLHATLLS